MISIQIQTNPNHYIQIHIIPNKVLMNVFAWIKYVPLLVLNTYGTYLIQIACIGLDSVRIWFVICSYLVCLLSIQTDAGQYIQYKQIQTYTNRYKMIHSMQTLVSNTSGTHQIRAEARGLPPRRWYQGHYDPPFPSSSAAGESSIPE